MNKIYKLLFLAIALMSLGACSDNSFNELDNALLKEPNYLTNVFTPTISVEQINQTAVQTNGLGGYLLGKYTQFLLVLNQLLLWLRWIYRLLTLLLGQLHKQTR